MVAKPATNDYGTLSILVQYAAKASLAFQVSTNCFRPRPEVGSAVVTLVMRRPPVQVNDETLFARVVRAAFAHRRKTISNSLRDEGLSSEQVAQALAQVGIDPTRRAETLTIEEFASLANVLRQVSARA